MPSFRGIEISVFAQSVAGQLPEYPHPDASCHPHTAPDDHIGLPPAADQDEETRNKGTNPVISVYIPSAPGSQFWINYVVEHELSPPCHLFFKLYMNGRHITAWGINPRIKRTGRAEKALYEPSERWNQEENGVVFKQEGIEARYFHFVGGQPEKSVAEDGGVVEVQVFRAKGRKRRAAKLDQYRNQDKYGITAPSGGLLDNPQDVTFFDFHLIDPKDAPFAVFRFHYRSWEHLSQLHLIPSETLDSFELWADDKIDEEPNRLPQQCIIGSAAEGSVIDKPSPFVRTDPDASVFDDTSSSGGLDGTVSENCKPRRNSSYMLRTPPQLRPRSITSHNLPQPSKTLRDGVVTGYTGSVLQRPLPDRPLPELPTVSPGDTWLGPSRKSSSASVAPSVAPSLISYVKNESYLNETVEYGQAQEVQMEKNRPGVPVSQEKPVHSSEDIPVTGYNAIDSFIDSPYNDLKITTPLSTEKLSPVSILKLTTHNTAESRAMSIGNAIPAEYSDTLTTENDTTRSRDLALDFAKFPHLKQSESDWKPRTPSPQLAPRRILSPRLGRLWSTLRRNKSRSPLRDAHNDLAPRNYSTPQLTGPEVKERHGNWI